MNGRFHLFLMRADERAIFEPIVHWDGFIVKYFVFVMR